MLSKPRLIKKGTEEALSTSTPKVEDTTVQQRVLITQKAIQTTKDWLSNRRQQQSSARQAFASLFMSSEARQTQSS